jgi:hypothetical protein
MLFGCADCLEGGDCDTKVFTAVILPAASPDGTGSYCPHTYDCTGGPCLTTCAAASNMVAWLMSQWTMFQNDADFPWNQCAYAIFTDSTSTSPSSVTGPSSGACGSYGGPSEGSGFTINFSLVAANGAMDGPLCAIAQMVAFRMTGELFIAPLNISGVTEDCLDPAQSLACSPGAGTRKGTYYIPIPGVDATGAVALCDETFGSGGVSGYQVQYTPYGASGSKCAGTSVILTWGGGAYTNCDPSPEDPFFGDNPP